MNLSKTGKLISQLRRERGLTQRDVATELGILPKTVSKWETGHGFPDVELICTPAILPFNAFSNEVVGTSLMASAFTTVAAPV